jgi:ubiquinone/menaquinone biosynthesis C-methylase UbiE
MIGLDSGELAMCSDFKIKKNCEAEIKSLFDSQSEKYGLFQNEGERFAANFERQRILIRIFNDRPSYVSVLDLGCGWGRNLSFVSRYSVIAVGVDLSKQMLITGKKRFRNLDIDFVQGDMKHLPFRDRAFDLVYSVRAFKYSSDPYRVLEETYRISRNDGLVSIYEGNKRTSLSYLIYLLRYPLSKRRHFWSAGVSPFLMKKYCATAGFGKISYDGVLFLPERFYGIGKTRKVLELFALMERVASKTPFFAIFARGIIYTAIKKQAVNMPS